MEAVLGTYVILQLLLAILFVRIGINPARIMYPRIPAAVIAISPPKGQQRYVVESQCAEGHNRVVKVCQRCDLPNISVCNMETSGFRLQRGWLLKADRTSRNPRTIVSIHYDARKNIHG